MTTPEAQPRMTAVVCHGPEDYRVEQVAKPHAGANELVIRIAACGICASDCKCYTGAKMFWGGPNPWVKAPVIPGMNSSATSKRSATARRSISASCWATA